MSIHGPAARPPRLALALLLWAGGCATPSSNGAEGTGAGGTTGQMTGTGSGGDTTWGPAGCWEDLEVGQTAAFYSGFVGGSEGIAFGLDGLMYVTADNQVWRLSPQGEAEPVAEVPDALGLAPWSGGDLVVASFGAFNQPDGAIYTVDLAGTSSLLAKGIDSPNFVTIAPDGSALISDDLDTRVFRVTPSGDLSVVIQDVPSPNGMAYGPDGGSFYVASTFTNLGQLTRYDVGADGLPVEASAREILRLGMGTTPDGIAVDEVGRVYVAANLAGEIWRVDGAAETVLEGERITDAVETPASLAFGVGPAYDPCSIYVTELSGTRIVRVAVGVEGAPLYPR